MNTLLSSGHTFPAEHRFPAIAKHEIFMLTSFTKSTGTLNTEQLYTILARAKFLMMVILPKIVKCLLDQIFRTFFKSGKALIEMLFPTRTL